MDGRSFVVLKPRDCDDDKSVWLWLAWSDTGLAAARYLPELIELTNMIGRVRIRFQTPFPGVVRLSKRVGWQLIHNEPKNFIMEYPL